MINLEKGKRINLEKTSGEKLTSFCVGCNWGDVVEKRFFGLSEHVVDVDLDLSCMMFNAAGQPIDHIWSPLYNFPSKLGLPKGKLLSVDHAIKHTGDMLSASQDNIPQDLDNEIITVDLNRVSSEVNSIVFFLNIYNNSEFHGDFSKIPYAYIRMFEGRPDQTPKEVFAKYNVATRTDCVGMRALVMAKLYRHNGDWKFAAIGDAFTDPTIVHTIQRVINSYNK